MRPMKQFDDDPLVTAAHVRIFNSGKSELFWRYEHYGHTSTDRSYRKVVRTAIDT